MSDLAMDAPYRPAALDRAEQGLLGKPIDRYEGPLKVSGAAPYAFEQAPEGTAYLAIVTAAIGRGRVTGIDAGVAEAMASGEAARLRHRPRVRFAHLMLLCDSLCRLPAGAAAAAVAVGCAAQRCAADRCAAHPMK